MKTEKYLLGYLVSYSAAVEALAVLCIVELWKDKPGKIYGLFVVLRDESHQELSLDAL